MIVPIKVTDEGEHYFEIPDEYLDELSWQAGDSVIWTQNEDGSFSLTKRNSNGYGLNKDATKICPKKFSIVSESR
ncbi:hypothetical protein ACPV5V_19240 [Vibrio campbellii]